VENWAEIRRLHRAEKMPIKAIARTVGVSKNTVRRALRSGEPPKYERAGPGSIVDAAEPRIRLLPGFQHKGVAPSRYMVPAAPYLL
jgi:transposase